VQTVNIIRGTEASTERHLNILTPYRKGNHPAWLKEVDLYEPLADEVAKNWGKRLSVTYRLRREALWAWRLFRLSKNYDAVLTGSDRVGLFLGIAQRILRRQRVPHIYLDFYINLDGRIYRRSLWRFFCRLAVGGASCAIVQRTCEVGAYSLALGLPASKFSFVPYHATIFEVEVDILEDGYIFAGGDEDRDYAVLIEAVRNLPYRVVIASLRKDHFVNVKIPENVEIVTVPAPDFLNLMAHASLIVVPLKRRPQHVGGEQTYLNAMTMGKPTVITDLEASDYVSNGITGILTPPGDVEALKEVITRIMEDRDFAHNLGRNGKEASLGFTPKNFFTAVFDLCTRYVAKPLRWQLENGQNLDP
jgi:glycosyltransferase involved in cell wall biosynthesis